MKEYIDREPLIKNLKEMIINPQTAFINNVLIGLLKDAPVTDVVEVVRCGECVHSKKRNKEEDTVMCLKHMAYKGVKGFCNEGEKKKDGE